MHMMFAPLPIPTYPTYIPCLPPCRCLPGLLVLGGFHSGTGALVHALKQHPHVMTDSSSSNQFWAGALTL